MTLCTSKLRRLPADPHDTVSRICCTHVRRVIISPIIIATGGTISDFEGRRYHTFTSSGEFIVTDIGSTEGTIISDTVAGGGGGGGRGGGGGGGRVNATENITVGVYTVVVGLGGVGATGLFGALSTKGGNSTFLTHTAEGGGRGAISSNTLSERVGGNGGCGGGGSIHTSGSPAGAGGTGSQGGNGGQGKASANFEGGGGGGMGGAGTGNAANPVGGVGVQIDYAGVTTYVSGGGGGGGTNTGGVSGGLGGGGKGGTTTGAPPTAGANGTNGLGGGGGGIGSAGTGGNGGSGVVIISYPII